MTGVEHWLVFLAGVLSGMGALFAYRALTSEAEDIERATLERRLWVVEDPEDAA